MVRIGLLTSVGRTIDAFFPEMIAQWEKDGHTVATAASTGSGISGHTNIRSLSRRPEIRNLRAPIGIRRWIAQENIDVLITNTAVASFASRAMRQPCPVVYFCHGLHWNTGHSLTERVWQSLERAALRHTDGVIVINSDDENWFARRLTHRPLVRLPGGVGLDTERYSIAPMKTRNGRIELLWAAEFTDRKRPRDALQFVHAARVRGVNVALTMCGDGPLLAQARESATELGIDEHVAFVGHVNDIPRRLRDSHGLLLTSKWEGLPRIGLEAIAIGRPVYAFDVKGVRDLPGVILAPEGDYQRLIEALESTDPDRMARHEEVRHSIDVRTAALDIADFIVELVPQGQRR